MGRFGGFVKQKTNPFHSSRLIYLTMVQYLIRLDDLCPTNDIKKWTRFFNLFDQYQIKPIIAVIPDNKDPKLLKIAPENPAYWPWVRSLQKKKYIIGMHGYEHRYQINNSGLLKANNRSEFAGLSYQMQEEKISLANEIFIKEQVKPLVFVAPAHTFDHNTLKAIKNCTDIKIISDGLLDYPYKREYFKWVPVQLSEPTWKPHGTWTLNFHPETCSDELFLRLTDFIELHHHQFADLNTLRYKPFTWKSQFAEKYLVYKRLSKDWIKQQLFK